MIGSTQKRKDAQDATQHLKGGRPIDNHSIGSHHTLKLLLKLLGLG